MLLGDQCFNGKQKSINSIKGPWVTQGSNLKK